MNCLQSWPAPIVRVQSLSDSGMQEIPESYVKRPSDRPCLPLTSPAREVDIPVIDLQNLLSDDPSLRRTTLTLISSACREWGLFLVVNHGVSHHLMARALQVWHEFFQLPVEAKQAYANTPTTYEGYGSRLGVEEGAKLDWSDYFFLNYLPLSLRDQNKWPSLPSSCRGFMAEYNEALVKLCGELMKILSINLGLEENYLRQAFGGEEIGACVRVSFYPKCPQPDLTLGLSPHSDPGGMTLLLADDHVSGLEVRRGDNWVMVKPLPNAFIVNIEREISKYNNNIKEESHQSSSSASSSSSSSSSSSNRSGGGENSSGGSGSRSGSGSGSGSGNGSPQCRRHGC